MKEKGTALIVTLVYIAIVSVICVSVLAFGVQHYMLMSQRVDKFQNMYYAEGGIYLGLRGTTGAHDIEPGKTVNISSDTAGTDYNLTSQRDYIP